MYYSKKQIVFLDKNLILINGARHIVDTGVLYATHSTDMSGRNMAFSNMLPVALTCGLERRKFQSNPKFSGGNPPYSRGKEVNYQTFICFYRGTLVFV